MSVNQHGDFSPSEVGSNDSSTVSEFVRSRFNGDVPVFGGQIRNGMLDFSNAIAGSATHAANNVGYLGEYLITALSRIDKRVDKLEHEAHPPIGSPGITPTVSKFPVVLTNNDDKSVDDLELASQMDTEKIQLLLNASAIDVRDIAKYTALLKRTKNSALKKMAAMRATELRKKAKLSGPNGIVLEDEEFPWQFAKAHVMAEYLGFPTTDRYIRPISLALTHDSFTNGKQTNRGLALLGDAALRLALVDALEPLDKNYVVGSISDILTTTQTGDHMYERAIKLQLAGFIRAAEGVDVTSRDTLSTVVEALYGIGHALDGDEGVASVDNYFRIISDGVAVMTEKADLSK